MENVEETFRLEMKTDPEAVRKQARWCGIMPGMRILDAGCGPGKITSILHEMLQPGGSILGVDYSQPQISYAQEKYTQPGIQFMLRDLRESLEDFGLFDFIWGRFVLEYNRMEAPQIVRNLTACLKPGGSLCLLDLDYNCLTHYQLPNQMEPILLKLMERFEQEFNFDAYAGRKLYAYLFDMGYEDIQVDMAAHHLIYGQSKDVDVFNWIKKLEIVTDKAPEVFEDYPGGQFKFFDDFIRFFKDPKRFTYTPLILCKGMKAFI
ncbi:MAG: class I SAM-dependent methyltransferase [Thermodesulfobacteriota bacterium]